MPRRIRTFAVILAASAVALGLLTLTACSSEVEVEVAPTAQDVVPTATTAAPATELPTETVPDVADPVESAPEPVAPSATLNPGTEDDIATPVPPPPTAGTFPQVAAQAVALAQAALAQQLGLSEQDITVRSVQAVEWSDSSLGCPQPGRRYMQVVTPGYRVVLEAGTQTYEYHTDGQGQVILCGETTMVEAPPKPGQIEPGLEALIDLAKADLVQELQIPIEQIEVLAANSVVWPDASLGCPVPGMKYKQIPMDGALIRLQAEGQVYDYHSGGGRDPFLCVQPLKLDKDAPPQIDLLQMTPGDSDQ